MVSRGYKVAGVGRVSLALTEPLPRLLLPPLLTLKAAGLGSGAVARGLFPCQDLYSALRARSAYVKALSYKPNNLQCFRLSNDYDGGMPHMHQKCERGKHQFTH